MPITFVGAVTGFAVNGAVTLTFPAGVQQNDIVIVTGGGPAAAANTAGVSTAGYTTLLSVGTTVEMYVGIKRMGASPDASAVCIASGTAQYAYAYIAQIWRGVDTTTATDATLTLAGPLATGTPDAPAITTVTAAALVIAMGVAIGNDTAVGTITSYTNQSSVTSGGQAARSSTVAMSSRTVGISTENPAAWNAWAKYNNWRAATVALRSAQSTNTSIAIPQGNAAYSSSAPSLLINKPITPTRGDLVFSSSAPTISRGTNIIIPQAADLHYTSLRPEIFLTPVVPHEFHPDQAHLVFSSIAPEVRMAFNIAMSSGNLAFSSSPPTLQLSNDAPIVITPSAGQLQFVTSNDEGPYAPDVINSGDVSFSLGIFNQKRVTETPEQDLLDAPR